MNFWKIAGHVWAFNAALLGALILWTGVDSGALIVPALCAGVAFYCWSRA